MRPHTVLCLLVLTVNATASRAEPEYEAIRLVIPQGDEVRGRIAFRDLYCTACHGVLGDEELPGPIAAVPGPLLGERALHGNPSALASAIVSPSHTMDEETLARIQGKGDFSPMGDFSEAMTVRQLVDIVAYLSTASESE